MNLSIKVDTRALENKLYLLAKAARVAPGQVIQEETKQATQQIIKLTPPRDLAQGRKAVAADMSRIVYAPPAENVKWATLRDALKSRNVAAATAILANKRDPKYTFTTSTAAIRQQHMRMRTTRGRINRGVKPRLAAFASDAGRYLREIQSRVGWAKGSWARTLAAAGGRAPSWIAKHAARAGTVIFNWGENPRVVATAFNIKIPGYQRMVDTAIRTRERITQRKIDRIVAGQATNLGFVVILERK